MALTEKWRKHEIRWCAGVPVGTNPLILLDFLTILIIIALLCWGILLAAQFYFDGHVEPVHLYGAAVIAFDLCLLSTVFYAIVCFIVMRNSYAALYRLDEAGAHCDNLKCRPVSLDRKLFHICSYPVEEPNGYDRSVEKHVSWDEVANYVELRSLRVLLLKGRRGTLMRIYCPSKECYSAVLTYLTEKLAG